MHNLEKTSSFQLLFIHIIMNCQAKMEALNYLSLLTQSICPSPILPIAHRIVSHDEPKECSLDADISPNRKDYWMGLAALTTVQMRSCDWNLWVRSIDRDNLVLRTARVHDIHVR